MKNRWSYDRVNKQWVIENNYVKYRIVKKGKLWEGFAFWYGPLMVQSQIFKKETAKEIFLAFERKG